MRNISSDTEVKGGFYFDRNEWDIVVVPGEKGILKGSPNARFLRVPALALFLLAPLLGGLFVLFLPFIGFAMLFEEVGRRIVGSFRRLGAGAAEAVTPAWRPGEAYLVGEAPEKPAAGEKTGAAEPDSLEGLIHEIDEKKKRS